MIATPTAMTPTNTNMQNFIYIWLCVDYPLHARRLLLRQPNLSTCYMYNFVSMLWVLYAQNRHVRHTANCQTRVEEEKKRIEIV